MTLRISWEKKNRTALTHRAPNPGDDDEEKTKEGRMVDAGELQEGSRQQATEKCAGFAGAALAPELPVAR